MQQSKFIIHDQQPFISGSPFMVSLRSVITDYNNQLTRYDQQLNKKKTSQECETALTSQSFCLFVFLSFCLFVFLSDNDDDDWRSQQVDYGSGSQPRLVSPSMVETSPRHSDYYIHSTMCVVIVTCTFSANTNTSLINTYKSKYTNTNIDLHTDICLVVMMQIFVKYVYFLFVPVC